MRLLADPPDDGIVYGVHEAQTLNEIWRELYKTTRPHCDLGCPHRH